MRVGFSSRRRPLRSSLFDGRGAHPRIWRESCRSPLKFAQRRATPQRQGTSEGSREALGRQERTIWTAWEAPGRQERTSWTACEAPGMQERTNWTTGEASGRQDRTNWTTREAPGVQERPSWKPGRHQEGRKGPFGEAGKDHLESLGGRKEIIRHQATLGRQERSEAPGNPVPRGCHDPWFRVFTVPRRRLPKICRGEARRFRIGFPTPTA